MNKIFQDPVLSGASDVSTSRVHTLLLLLPTVGSCKNMRLGLPAMA